MSASTELKSLIRRHSVGTQADVAEDASVTAMVIHAAADASQEVRVDPRLMRSVQTMLDRIDQLARYRESGGLHRFFDDDYVAKEQFAPLWIIARIAQPEAVVEDEGSAALPAAVERLIGDRDSIEIKDSGDVLSIKDGNRAELLAQALERLASDALNAALDEDRSRTSKYATA